MLAFTEDMIENDLIWQFNNLYGMYAYRSAQLHYKKFTVVQLFKTSIFKPCYIIFTLM